MPDNLRSSIASKALLAATSKHAGRRAAATDPLISAPSSSPAPAVPAPAAPPVR
jgi:hypothetical protein